MKKTYEEWLEQIKSWDRGIEHTPREFRTYEMYLEYVKQCGYLAIVPEEYRTEEVCLAAVKQNGYALKEVNNQTEEICLEAVKKNSRSLYFVKNKTEEICLTVIQKVKTILLSEGKSSFKFDIILDRLNAIDSSVLQQINSQELNNQIEELQLKALMQNIKYFKVIKSPMQEAINYYNIHNL